MEENKNIIVKDENDIDENDLKIYLILSIIIIIIALFVWLAIYTSMDKNRAESIVNKSHYDTFLKNQNIITDESKNLERLTDEEIIKIVKSTTNPDLLIKAFYFLDTEQRRCVLTKKSKYVKGLESDKLSVIAVSRQDSNSEKINPYATCNIHFTDGENIYKMKTRFNIEKGINKIISVTKQE